MSPERGPFDARLRRAIRAEAARFQPVTDASRVEEAVARAHRGRIPIALLALPAAVLGIALAIRTPAPSAPGGGVAHSPRPSPIASARAGSAPIGLADCQIAPADSSLAFAGWTTLDVLGVRGGKAANGQPIYAVVTRGLAEWVGWQENYSGPMFPAPIGRMGCIYDPSTGESSLIGVPLDWHPPATADGCPVSPLHRIGQYREAGGPRGWLVLPQDTARWYVGDFSYLMSFRLSPPPEPGQTVSAWAERLDGTSQVNGEVVLNPTGARPAEAVAADEDASGYYFVNLRFNRPGCWVIGMSVNGSVAGSAILPIGALSGQPTPRPSPASP